MTRIALSCAVLMTFAAFARDTAESVLAFDRPTVTRIPVIRPGLAQEPLPQVIPTSEVLAPVVPAAIPADRVPVVIENAGPMLGGHPTTLTRIKSGLASWYGSVLDGHRTASGRRFDMNELTAAHRDLPFGSKVKVTNLRNHRSVVVTVTDRGVLFDERIIDLSYGAAKELQMIKSGVDAVSLDLITTAKAPAPLR